MAMAEKIKIMLVKRKMSTVDLAKKLGCTSTNIYNKLKRDNFSERELRAIAKALDCAFEAGFTMNDTLEKV